MCLMRPLKQTEALCAEQAHPPGCSAVSKNKPCSHKETFHPITAHSHGQGLHLPRFWTDLMVPHLRNPTCPSQHLHPELNTAAGLIQHHKQGFSTEKSTMEGSKKGRSAEKSPALPSTPALVGLEHTFLTGELSDSSSGLSSRRWTSTVPVAD